MVLGAAAGSAAAAAAGGSLFEYNRKNFLYDRKMRQETEYQIMDFRIRQAQLWREDVKDIIGLTSVKMDTYLIVNAVQLGFCVMAFCEGRLEVGTPVWLIGCHTLSLAGAFMFLLMSVWLSMHASVTAKSYEVRLLTQLVRLPVPSWAQLEGARTYASGFEKSDPKQMFRVPFLMGTQERVLGGGRARGGAPGQAAPEAGAAATDGAAGAEGAGDSADATADVWGLERRGDKIYELDGALRADPSKLRHLRLVREAMQYWQSYDGFARVAMSVGTNQLVMALSYYVIGYVLISNHAVIASWLVVMLFMVVAAALIRLDMSLTGPEYYTAVLLIISGPCLTAVAAEEWSRHTSVGQHVAGILAPIAYLASALWLTFLLYISNVREQRGGAMLPTGFRSVMYIDVFGWIRRARGRTSEVGARPSVAGGAPGGAAGGGAGQAATRMPGSGPAVQAVRYDDGEPVPLRPEELPGAAQSPFALEGLRKEDFEPTTFVPREKEGEQEDAAPAPRARWQPGAVPWRLFCSATVLLVCLWWISGVFVLLSSFGVEVLTVAPLEHEGGEGAHHGGGEGAHHGGGGEGAHGGEEHHGEGHAALMQFATPRPLVGGERLPTSWPLGHAQPMSLACGGGQAPTLVSSSHFAIFTAKLDGAAGDGARRVAFEALPPCRGIRGEALQDVALSCPDGAALAEGACRALVLHRQGELLSACAISKEGQGNANGGGLETWRLAAEWLGDGSLADGVPQEEVSSISLAPGCEASAEGCTYARTSGRRIVELQMAGAAAGPEGPHWLPTRILEADGAALDAAQGGGALRFIDGHHLGVLHAGKRLRVIDPSDGSIIGEWQLPPDQRWKSMCSTGNDLYLLSEGNSPEIWRFPTPDVIQSRGQAAAVPIPEHAVARSASPRLHSRAFLNRHEQPTPANI